MCVRPGKGQGLTVAPYAAGHLIGGAVWRISLDGEDMVYAVDYNHRKERHLNGATLDSVFSRPAVLITGASVSVRQEISEMSLLPLRAT